MSGSRKNQPRRPKPLPDPVVKGTLTKQDQQFVEQYLRDLNGAAAMRRCGYTGKRADAVAYERLRKLEVQHAIAEGRARQLKEADISAIRVLEEIRRVALVDIRDFYDPVTGNLLPVSAWTKEMGAVVASLEVVKRNLEPDDGLIDQVYKLKLWDKLKGLELLRDYLGLVKLPGEEERTVPVFVIQAGAPRIATK